MHVVESLGNLLRMCEMWSLPMKNRAFWHGNKCLHSYSTVCAWRNWKVCANVTSCRCAFGLIVSNRLNLYYKRHLDSHIIGYRYNAVQYIMLMHTVLQWQQQDTNQTLNSQKTLYHVQAMGCLLCVGIWGKIHHYDTITLYMNIFKAKLTETQWRISELYHHWLI